MKIELGDIITLSNTKYMVAEMSTYMETDYLLLNKLDMEEEPSQEFYIYKKNDRGLILITDKNILNILYPVFSNKLQKEINDIQSQNKYNID